MNTQANISTEPEAPHYLGSATYDPDDNKLRLRADSRLSPDDYARAKACGFQWAPRQSLFYASWSPAAEDLLVEWCGDIEDEDTSLAERAQDRAERFGVYSEHRERDGDRAEAAVRELADGIPLGQPILVGHHSERRARKDAERIERGMARALKNWRTAEYWKGRAAGVVANAAYKDRPEVRARRIKTLEAERRRLEADYTTPEKYRGQVAMSKPIADCWRTHGHDAECERCERQPHVAVGQGRAVHLVPVRLLDGIKERNSRWIAHLDRRLEYERAILAEQGAEKLLDKKPRPTQPPLLNYRAPDGIVVRNQWRRDEPERMGQVDMTKAEWSKLYADYKGTRLSADGSHRVRSALVSRNGGRSLALVFITDSKAHDVPGGVA